MDYCLGDGDGSATMWSAELNVDADDDGIFDAIGLDFDGDGRLDDALTDSDGEIGRASCRERVSSVV